MRTHIALLLVFLLPALNVFAAQRPSAPAPPVNQRPPFPGDDRRDRESRDETEIRMEKERQKKLNEDRQKALKKDTEHLVELASELKQYVDKTSENVLSVDVVKKAEEIEKLAKSVKDKMKGNG